MKVVTEVPELDTAMAQHAAAILAGDTGAIRGFISPAAGDTPFDVIAGLLAKGKFSSADVMGKAKIGFQFCAKVQLLRGDEKTLLLIRWRNEDAVWRIAEIEDMSGKRSPWSDIETPPALKDWMKTVNGRA